MLLGIEQPGVQPRIDVVDGKVQCLEDQEGCLVGG